MARTEGNETSNKCFCCCFAKDAAINENDGYSIRPKSEVSATSTTSANKVPYSGELPNNLTLGNVICITGLVLPNCIRFAVNLINGKERNPDIAFHLNPRLDRRYIVRNSLLNGRWGQEETASTVKCNLVRNKKFEINIFVANEEFLVSINGVHFCNYKFRSPLNLCTHLEVEGGVTVDGVEYKTYSVYPESNIQDKLIITDIDKEETTEVDKLLAIPYIGHLPKGFQEGWQLEIYGRVKLLPHSFYINLQEGSQVWPHPNIPLHLNPRFGGENIFVRNAWFDGRWGSEERTCGFRFSPGATFALAIQRTCDQFAVWLDGQLVGEFAFRGPVNKIDTVYIEGDVVLNKIIMQEKLVNLHNKT